MLTFADTIDPDLTPIIAGWSEAIRQHLADRLTDLVPSYTTIMLYYEPRDYDYRSIISALRTIPKTLSRTGSRPESRRIELPVWYHPSVGPDLEDLANTCGITVDQVIERHTATEYQVYALGFSPGFGFMGQVDPSIACGRLDSPRVRVPGGSVGIANRQTAVYPSPSPGGWRLIGRCPTRLFSEEDLATLAVGDRVRFQSVDRDAFLRLGGDDTPFEKTLAS